MAFPSHRMLTCKRMSDLSCGLAHFLPILPHQIGIVIQVRLIRAFSLKFLFLLDLSCYWSIYLIYDLPRGHAWLVIYTT
jgi:hypothetical protein